MPQPYYIQIEQKGSPAELAIQGRFSVPVLRDGVTRTGAEVLKHIVLVVSRGDNYQSVDPFKNVMVFKDDILEKEGVCHGNFFIHLPDHIGFSGSGDYYCLCSLGVHLSNIVKIST